MTPVADLTTLGIGETTPCKPTHIDRYLHFSSHHHKKQLLSTICSLRDRAHKVCDTSERGKELSHLSKVFHTNGYPKPLVRHTLSRTPPSSSKEECRVDNVDEDDDDNAEIEQPKILCLPYIKGVSETIIGLSTARRPCSL